MLPTASGEGQLWIIGVIRLRAELRPSGSSAITVVVTVVLPLNYFDYFRLRIYDGDEFIAESVAWL